MSLYKGQTAKEAGSSNKVEAGPYKFKVVEVKHYDQNSSVGMRLELWKETEKVTDKFWDFINIDEHAKDAILAETDRRLTTLLGKPELENVEQLMGKTGYVVVRAGARNGEVYPFGGYYNTDRKSAAGNETMSERIKDALSYDWTKDKYAVERENKRKASEGKDAPASTPETDDQPF